MKGSKKKRNRLAHVWGGVRFLGAYRKGSEDFVSSFVWELGEGSNVERACVALRGDCPRLPALGGIGLLFASTSIRRVFVSDCWSELNSRGELYPTRRFSPKLENTGWERYEEAFLRKGALPVAIVVEPRKISNDEILAQVGILSNTYGIPVILYNEGSIKRCLRERRRGL